MINNKQTKLKQKYRITVNEKWFVNKTSVAIPEDIQFLLSLGGKHALPNFEKMSPNTLFKLIADGEECIQTIEDNDAREKARANFANMLDNSLQSQKYKDYNKYILHVYQETKIFLMQHKEILIVPADKGNATVAIYKSDYKTKMKEMMEDRNTYWPIRTNPTGKLQTTNNNLVKELYDKNIISQTEKKRMMTYNPIAPRIYGLPKIHKEGMPLRPICSSVKVPCYNLSKYLISILKNLTSASKYNVKDSLHFKRQIQNTRIHEDEILVSFDVRSLFTNFWMTVMQN